jgi:hypothetical protein
MGRPPGYQWQPLGLDADPVPGDPQAISAETAHLASVAATITGQVAAMHKIASENTETGQHAETIRTAARRQAASLQAVATRYARVSSALSGWVPELEQAQAMSIRALNEAEVPYAALNRSVTLPSGPDLTDAQKQQITDHQASMRRAQEQLDAARVLLTRATTLRDTQAAYYAAKINQASNDSLTDHESLWGDITGFFGHIGHAVDQDVKDVAWIIKDACEVLEIAAAILAAVALFATGVGWLLAAAFILTGAALLGRTLLAATGNGSWLDVASDSVSLLLLGAGGGFSGLGGLVGRAGKTVASAVEAGDQLVTTERAVSISGRTTTTFGKIADFINSSRLLPDALATPFAAVAKFFRDYNEGIRPLASTIVKDAEETSAWRRIFAGGEEPARYAVQMRMLLARFPDSPEIAQLGEKFAGELRQVRYVVGAGTATSAAVTLANGGVTVYQPGGAALPLYDVPFWDRWEDDTTAGLPAWAVGGALSFNYVVSPMR